MHFLLRLVVNAAGLWVAARIVPGVSFTGDWPPFLAVALIFGVINATIRPVMKILTCPLILLTLGLFALIVNGLMLWLTGSVSAAFGLGLQVHGFWAAFWGGVVVSIVSTVLSIVLPTPDRREG